jgi:hypothetical protein
VAADEPGLEFPADDGGQMQAVVLEPADEEFIPGEPGLGPLRTQPGQPAVVVVRIAQLVAEAPSRGRLVEVLRDPLDDDQLAVGTQYLGDVVQRHPGILDVVEGERRDDRIGRVFWPVALERGLPVRSALRGLGIDARGVVSGLDQRRDVAARLPAAEFDDPGRRRRQLAPDERPGRREPDGISIRAPGRLRTPVAVSPAFFHAAW